MLSVTALVLVVLQQCKSSKVFINLSIIHTGVAQVATGRDARGAGAGTGQAGDVEMIRVPLQGMVFVYLLVYMLKSWMLGHLVCSRFFQMNRSTRREKKRSNWDKAPDAFSAAGAVPVVNPGIPMVRYSHTLAPNRMVRSFPCPYLCFMGSHVT